MRVCIALDGHNVRSEATKKRKKPDIAFRGGTAVARAAIRNECERNLAGLVKGGGVSDKRGERSVVAHDVHDNYWLEYVLACTLPSVQPMIGHHEPAPTFRIFCLHHQKITFYQRTERPRTTAHFSTYGVRHRIGSALRRRTRLLQTGRSLPVFVRRRLHLRPATPASTTHLDSSGRTSPQVRRNDGGTISAGRLSVSRWFRCRIKLRGQTR